MDDRPLDEMDRALTLGYLASSGEASQSIVTVWGWLFGEGWRDVTLIESRPKFAILGVLDRRVTDEGAAIDDALIVGVAHELYGDQASEKEIALVRSVAECFHEHDWAR